MDHALGVRAAAQGRLPAVKDAGWPRNPIDRFILARLEAEGLASVAGGRRNDLDPPRLPRPDRPAADPQRRGRVSGRPAPTRPTRTLVDRLLDSPRYGEHMARFWLDAARYGDTHGLHLDNYREIWPYRDWVIKAFNANKPFDQFIVEQLAGDLLAQPHARPARSPPATTAAMFRRAKEGRSRRKSTSATSWTRSTPTARSSWE